MKRQFVVALFSIAVCSLPVRVSAQSIEGFTVFGDSLSDNGNAFRTTGGLIPPSPPYVNGRFTNGPVWIEDLAARLNLTPTTVNFAFGGATSGTANTLPIPSPLFPGTTTQVNLFLQNSPRVSADQAFVVWTGANDYLGGGVTNPAIPVGNISSILQRLTAAGAEKLIVLNLPDLGKVPGTIGNPAQSAGLTQLSAAHNQGLRASLQALAQSQPNVTIIPIDIAALVNEVTTEPARFGFTNVTTPCIGTGANCDQFLYWDALHPTTRAHRIISEYAFDILTAPQTIVPQAEIALGVAGRPTTDLNGRLVTLRSPNPNQRLGVFVNGDFNFGNRDSSDRTSGFDFDTKGVIVGADYRVTDDLALGLAFNYFNNSSDLNSNRGNVSIDSYSLSAYGSYNRDRLYADAVINYGWNNFDIERNIQVTGFRPATASTDGNQFSVRLNTGYNLGQNQLAFGPMVGVRYTKVNIDGYTERNGSILNLNVQDQEADSVVLNVGAQVSYDFRSPSATITPYLAANYEREFANGSREIVTELVSQPGIPNRTQTDSPDRDFVRLSAGVQTQFANNLSIGVGYETILGKRDVSDHAVQARLRYQF
ncbi:autotransporter domain-containing protein [Leptolyngbya sp. AN03gr2]|uniref:autotransporter domain-containing protein n=1 Tax=unclassified Leptolyngbya TaxID=2650499 RepID=UPI003D321C8A